MLEWLNGIPDIAKIVSGLLVLWGFGKGIVKFLLKPYQARKNEKLELEKRMVAEQRNFQTKVLAKMDTLEHSMRKVERISANIVRDRLESAHTHFVDNKGFCPKSTKRNLIEMYEDYSGDGHNSLVESYAEDILSLPDEPRQVQ